MKWILIKESRTPSDIETINASFNHDVSDEWSDKDKKTYEMLKNKPGIIKVRRIKEGKFEVHIADIDN